MNAIVMCFYVNVIAVVIMGYENLKKLTYRGTSKHKELLSKIIIDISFDPEVQTLKRTAIL